LRPFATGFVLLAVVGLALAVGSARAAEEEVELDSPPPRPILAAPLDDRSSSDVIINRVSLSECGRLVVVGGSAATEALGRTLPLGADPETGAARGLAGLLLADARTHVTFPVPKRFRPDEGTLAITWQPSATVQEFGALFCSDADTAFEAFFAGGRLYFRVAGGQVSAEHRPVAGEWHRYRFLWDRQAGRRSIFVDDRLVAEKRRAEWQDVEVGKELLINARANLAFPGQGGAPGFYAHLLIYDRALAPEPEPAPAAEGEPGPEGPSTGDRRQ